MTSETPSDSPPACPLCGKTTRPWLRVPGDWRRPHIDAAFQLYWCDESAYGFVHPRPSREDIAAAYDIDDYYTHDVASATPESGPTSLLDQLRERLAWSIDHGASYIPEWFSGLYPDTSLRVCDIGCGNGANLERFRALGYDAVGVEPDPKACRRVRELGFTVHEGFAEDIPDSVERNAFDVVIASHVLEHCPDPIAALKSARSLLAPGGIFICEVPNNASHALTRRGAAWLFLDVPRHLNFYTAKSLELALTNAGLALESTRYSGYNRQLSQAWVSQEAAIRRILARKGGGSEGLPPGNSALRSWGLLAKTVFASRDRKYYSVRMLARISGARRMKG